MASPDLECLRVAEPQLGLITIVQAMKAGLSQDQIDDRVQSGRWRRMHRGVYSIGGLPPTWNQRAMAATLYCEGPASHRTAGFLWGFSGVEKGPIEVITTRKIKAPDVMAHRRIYVPEWVSRKNGIPVTDPTETLLDLASVSSVGRLEVAVDSALRLKLSHLPLLRCRLEERARQGRNGIRIMRAILQARDVSYAISQSDLESMFLRFVRRYGLPSPKPQHVISDPDWGFVGRPDFVYPRQRVAIELQSYAHHGGRSEWEKDQARFGDFAALDWVLITVTYLQLKLDPGRTAERIKRVLWSRNRLYAG